MEKNKLNGKRGEVDDDMKWVHDSSFDHNGRVPLRASTGAWKASFFIIAIEFSERLSYFGIATSLVIYLTKVMHQDLKTAVRNVNYWSGVTTLMPLFGGFLADSYLGRYTTVIASCIIYLMGLVLLTLSWFLPSLKPCAHSSTCIEPRKIHEVFFFLAIYLISIGTGGHKPSLESFGADQFDDNHIEERRQKMSFFNWWNCGLCSGLILGVTLIVYVQDHVNWGVADIILTCVMTFSLLIFVIGSKFYRYRIPNGSPLTPMLQVIVAAISKRKLPYPSNPTQLYEVSKAEGNNGRLLAHTKKLKFFDKAAIVESEGNLAKEQSPWKLATVTRVEEMKLMINMIPIWIFTLPFGMCAAQTSTFFIKQGNIMNRKIGHGFEIPPASIFTISAIGMIISVAIYDKILVPVLRKISGNERGMNILQRIGIGMVFSVLTMIVAALVEKKRLKVVEMNPSHGSLSMSVFWLAPQFLIIGFGDGLALVGLQEYFYDQVPDSMRSLGIGLYLSVIGAANFLSSLLITIVDHVTSKSGKSWFGEDLNSSRLDKFYWLLAAITTLSVFVFVLFAQRYTYKNVQNNVVADCYDGKCDDGGAGRMV
ncbi:putative proton-dependent oligopeptide transporter family, major facilitator superfamily [Medicago truncatula]|uniref:Peptide/nitrate transporter plant n=1 Tax=Medicago truncatula TaxID=3880 RepID=A0A072UIQ6_MEDTR|nr:protein NRT1/ PTR FAMILY 5.6 [Medicago truncatula]KEH28963.1 peptide/nitrate transporter plant [Medicago truncatula]RHN59008.1 putative proton-dependent oligopeptide transporter family, major facilitator superfamily [Medicago truncatula]